MGNKSEKMYAKPPKMERDDNGKLGVKKPAKADAVEAGVDGMPMEVQQAHDRVAMKHRHQLEMMAMHHKQESEHSAHDAAKGGAKAALHGKHEKEHKEMTDRHHSEMKKTHAKHAKGGLAEPKHEKAEMPKGEKKAGENEAGKTE